MDISPLEIQKRIRKSIRGYNKEEVDEFWIDYCKAMREFIKRIEI